MDNDLTIQLKILSTGVEKINQAKTAVDNLGTSTKNAGGKIDTFGSRFNNFNKKMLSVGSQINVLGQRMTWMVTVPLLAFANSSINTALEVEKSWLRMRKVFDGTEQDLAELKEAAWGMSTTYGIAFGESAEALTEFSKAGIQSKEDLSALGDLTAKTSILFDTDMTEALTGVKSIMFGFGLNVNQTAQELDAINIIADQTTASEKAVMEMLSKVSGTARAAGFSIREVAAAQSVFEASAIPAGRAGNAMKSILTSLTKQSNLAKDQFAELGVSMTDVEWKTSSGTEKLEKLAKKLAEVKEQGDKNILKKFEGQLGGMSKALGDMNEGPIEKLQLLKASLIEAQTTGDDVKLDLINKELEGLNIGGKDASENIDIMTQRLRDLESAGRTIELDQANEALASLVGKFQINNLNVLLQDMAKNFDDSEETVSSFYNALKISNNELDNAAWGSKQLEKVMGSNVVKVAALEQEYKKQSETLGNQLLPYKIKLMEILSGLLEKFNNLSPGTQEWILKLAGIVAIAGPVLAFIGLMSSGLSTILLGIGSLAGPIVSLTKGLGLIGNGAGAAAKAVGIKGIASGGLAGALQGGLLIALTAVTAYIVTEAIKAYGDLQDTMDGLKKANDDLKGATDLAYKKMLELPDGEYKDRIQEIIKKNKELMESNEAMEGRYDGFMGALRAVADTIKNDLIPWLDKLIDRFNEAKEKYHDAKDAMKHGGGGSWANGGIIGKFNKGGVVYAANGFFPKGKDTVPAMLSPGEMVLNQGQQSRLFDILAGKTQLAGGGGPVININVGNMIASRGEQREFARMIKERLEEDSNRY